MEIIYTLSILLGLFDLCLRTPPTVFKLGPWNFQHMWAMVQGHTAREDFWIQPPQPAPGSKRCCQTRSGGPSEVCEVLISASKGPRNEVKFLASVSPQHRNFDFLSSKNSSALKFPFREVSNLASTSNFVSVISPRPRTFISWSRYHSSILMVIMKCSAELLMYQLLTWISFQDDV